MSYNLSIPGWMTEVDLKHIQYLASQVLEGGRILEVGAYLGRTTWCLAKTAPTAKVISIDLWRSDIFPHKATGFTGPVDCTLENFKYWTSDCSNVETLQLTDKQLPIFSDPFDLIFIDANHSNPHVSRDIHHYIHALKPRAGVIMGDDFTPRFPDVMHEVNRFVQLSGCWFQHPTGTKLWVCKNIPQWFINNYSITV